MAGCRYCMSYATLKETTYKSTSFHPQSDGQTESSSSICWSQLDPRNRDSSIPIGESIDQGLSNDRGIGKLTNRGIEALGINHNQSREAQ